jgi:hypothetical protein
MNEIQGYYSCSINPSYISTWYTSFKKRSKIDHSEFINIDQAITPCLEFLNNQEIEVIKQHNENLKAERKPVNLQDNKHHGKISKIAFSKINKAIDYSIYLASPKSLPNTLHGKDFKFRLNLITLTLSSNQIHSDKEIKEQIFQPMLNTFREKFGVINYVWRAEKQANGSIHFHIITDKFIPWNDLRNSWNKHQNKLGYIDRYRQNMINFHKDGFQLRRDLLSNWSKEKQIKAYQSGIKNEWHNPNSTDVHSLRAVSNIKKYFVKYMTKDSQSADDRENKTGQYSDLDGRLWGCSSRLTNIKGARADLDNQLTEELIKLKEDKDFNTFTSDYYAVSFIDITKLLSKGYTLIYQLFEQYIRERWPEYRPPDLFSSLN